MEFPIELQDKIIDQLYDGDPTSSEYQAALCNCALVSHRWLKRTRKHLFTQHELLINGGVEPQTRQKTSKLVLAFESTPTSSTIAPYIRRIRIQGPDTLNRHTGLEKGSPEEYIECSRVMEAVLPHFRHVRVLSFQYLTWDLLSSNAKTSVLSISRVATISCKNVPRSTVSEMLSLACRTWASHLRVLDIDWVHVEPGSPPVSQPMDQLSRLMSLRIGARYDAAAGYHLLSPDTIRSMRSLKQLSIRTYEEASLSLLSRVGDLGPRLLHLELNIVMFWSFDISDAHIPFPLTLKYNTNLLTLWLTHPVHLVKDLWWVARIINSSTAPTLDIFITVSTRVSQALLSRSGLPALEDILIGTDNSPRTWTLHIYSEETPEPWFIDTMKILMPRLVENDRLMFHDDPLKTDDM